MFIPTTANYIYEFLVASFDPQINFLVTFKNVLVYEVNHCQNKYSGCPKQKMGTKIGEGITYKQTVPVINNMSLFSDPPFIFRPFSELVLNLIQK